jgi:hypothetical protein
MAVYPREGKHELNGVTVACQEHSGLSCRGQGHEQGWEKRGESRSNPKAGQWPLTDFAKERSTATARQK